MDDAKRDTHATMASGTHPDGGTTLVDGASAVIGAANGSEASATIADPPDVQPQDDPAPIMGRPVRQDDQDATLATILATPTTEESQLAPPQEPTPIGEPALVTKAARKPLWSQVLSVIIGSRWLLAIPAVWLALSAGYAVEQARSSLTARPTEPPSDSWQQFALAGLLLAIAVFPKRLSEPEGFRAYLRNLRAKNIGTWLDFALLIGASALVSAAAVYEASKVELLNWAVTTWLWPFLMVSTSNLSPLLTLALSWLALFFALVLAGLLATFIPGLRPAGPSVFMRELTRVPESGGKTEVTSVPEAMEAAPASEEPAGQATEIAEITSKADLLDQPALIGETATLAVGVPASAESAVVVMDGSAPDELTGAVEPATVDEKLAIETAQAQKPKKEEISTRGRRAVWRRVLLFFVPLGLSLACLGASVPLFTRLNQAVDPSIVVQNWWVNNGSWLLWIASMLLFGLTFVIWERTTRPPVEGDNPNAPLDRFPRWLEWVILLSLFGVAIYLRVKDLGVIPSGLWFDEGQDGIVGRQLVAPNAAHLTFIGDWTQMGALLWYFMGLVIKFMGNTVIAVRIIPAVMGALIAPMLYMLGARLYGWRTGLAAGGLVAMLDWNINWSRIGMASMPTVAMVVAIYLCMAQALRTGRLGYYAAAGILAGLALHMYYVSKLVPVVLILLLVHRLITERMRLVRSLRVGALVLVVGGIIAFTPAGLFAVQRPELYNARTDIVSIFSPENSPNRDSLKFNLESNVKAHFLMFNWQGDGNGRHNLPGTPMLDWITASLFFAGLVSCLLRIWRWQYAFPVVWGAGAISGGVFTLPFEAPQSHRTLELSVISALIAGIFIGQAWQAVSGAAMMEWLGGFFSWLFGRLGRAGGASYQALRRPIMWPARIGWVVSGATLLVLVWLAGDMNLHKYFDVQAQDLSVVKDMQSPQAEAARQTLLYGQNYDVYMSPVWQGVPQSQYLAPDVQTIAWSGLHALPLSPGKPGGTIIILDLPSVADMTMIARMYPHSHFDIYTAPNNPEPLVITIKIPDADIRAGRGVKATLTEVGSSKPSTSKILPDLNYDWGSQGARPGVMRFSTTLKAEQYGTYSFALKSASGDTSSDLLIDGYIVKAGQPITLEQGLHSVVATDTVKSASGTTQLLWSPPPGGAQQPVSAFNMFDPTKIEPHGLTGLYRPSPTFDGPVALARIDPVISYYYHNPPLPQPFTADWSGSIYIPEDGDYVFGTEQLNSAQLFVDDKLLVNNSAMNSLQEGRVTLTTGFHALHVQYLNAGAGSHMYLYWTPPAHGQSIIPSIFLWPKMGMSVAGAASKPESGDWPTLADADGKQIPPELITYSPPRPQGGQPQPGGAPPQVGQPAPPPANPQPQQPVSKGNIFQPLFLVGDSSVVSGRPRAGGVDKNGNIYIFTERESKIHKYDPLGKEVASWAVKGASGPLTEGSGLVVKDDHVYVLDAQTSDLIVFTLDGQPADNVHLCTCFYPRDVSLSKDGNFWVVNTGSNQVLKVDVKGVQVASLGEKGDKPGQFNEPSGVSEAPDGTLFVMDTSNKRVQSFSADLKPLAQWGVGASIARDGNRLASDGAGNVLVTQAEGHAIVMYDKNGKELNRWVYRRDGAELIPAGITSLGGDKFLALFPDSDVAAVFSTKGK